MLHAVVTTALQQIKEAVHIAAHVSLRILNGIAHTGLGCQVDDLIKLPTTEQTVHPLTIGDRHADEAAVLKATALTDIALPARVLRGNATLIETRILEFLTVIRIDVINSYDIAAGLRQR